MDLQWAVYGFNIDKLILNPISNVHCHVNECTIPELKFLFQVLHFDLGARGSEWDDSMLLCQKNLVKARLPNEATPADRIFSNILPLVQF